MADLVYSRPTTLSVPLRGRSPRASLLHPYFWAILPLKNRAEYDPESISATEAKAAVTAAARMVRIAEQTVKQVER